MESRVLERETELAALADAVRDATAGRGSVVLVSGEAGIGKSTLVAYLPQLMGPAGRLLIGWCDDLATPRVLGPFRDLGPTIGPPFSTAVESGDRGAVLDSLRAELATGIRPTLVVIEDVHWADEATLDVLSYFVRRVAVLPAAMILTYRDDEVAADHPLRQLLGLAARVAPVRRLHPARLSATAVRALSGDGPVDPDRLFGITSGNPYFVNEVLATGDSDAVPLTIADAVGARLARVDPVVLQAVRQLAVIPSGVDAWLVDAVVPGGLTAVAKGEQSGLVALTDGRVTFRHELTRRAVLHTMPAAVRVEAERRVLAALLTRTPVELSRVVHHAHGAGDRSALLSFGPLAAREAMAAGAHRQAVAHLRLVLGLQPDLTAADEAGLWEDLAIESYTVDAPSHEAMAAQRRAVELRRGGDPRALGAALRWLSRISWWAGDPATAASAGEEARSVLALVGDHDLHAMALSNQAQLHALAGRDEAAIALAEEGLALPDISPATRAHLLNNLGVARVRTRHPQGRTALEESLRVALAADEPEHACRAYVNLAWHEIEALDFDAARTHLHAGIALAERTEFLTFSRYLQLILAMVHFATGEWEEVIPAAAFAADGSPPIRCAALTVIGRLGARRGDPGAQELLDEAWQIALATGECQRIAPAAAAVAEAAVLFGEPSRAAAVVATAYGLAIRQGTRFTRAELGYWSTRVGPGLATDPRVEDLADEPYRLLTEGHWRAAREVWRAAGCRYEAAAALAHSDDADDLLLALAELDELRAEPLARSVRAALRLRGVTHVPRGPLPSTRVNPWGLTQRQCEVARLLTLGMTNAEIASHLFVSVRTVDSHVAAILLKLGVHSRRELLTRAAQFGLD